MSLPTYATFYKNDKVVGAGFCNPGWFITPESFKSCIPEAMDAAWERYRDIPKYIDSTLDRYFTTEEDLRNFEYMKLFGVKINRNIALAVYKKTITDSEWSAFFKPYEGKI